MPLLIVLFSVTSFAQQTYYRENKFWMTSPGAYKSGLYGFDNPAVLTYQNQPDFYFTWANENVKWNDFNNWGIFAAVPNFGFGLVNQKFDGRSVTDYKLSTAMGSQSLSVGLGFGWSSGDAGYFNRSNMVSLGTLLRPNPFISFGFTGTILFAGQNEGMFDLAIRPLGDEKISLFCDYVFKNNISDLDNKWSAGIALEAYPGFRLTGRYFDTKFFTVGIELNLGRIGFSSISQYVNNSSTDKYEYSYNTYGIRIGSYDRNPFQTLKSKNDYIDLNLIGGMKYTRFRFFDNSKTLYEILDQIKTASKDESVSGIAINTSGMNINREMLWEMREELRKFKETGKKVYVYIDRPGMEEYHFASIADEIVLDPQGMILLPGYVFGRQYYAGLLEKLGIGFHEWRYFKFKSAEESFSRKNMSEGDSIQWKKLIDDYYDLAKSDICSGRKISAEKFDELINNEVGFLPQDAVNQKLADTLGRWDTVIDLIKNLEGNNSFINPTSLTKYNLPKDNYWGEKPEIALIYAIGACAMDEGINARSLVNYVNRAVENNNVKAIVLRVDSPGGDALASDIIAEALKKAKGKKPVIISQGYVAGSGGYWLSMYGDTILAAPNTITGSIGVIGGWVYNTNFKEKLGITTDYVKHGDHAEIGFGIVMPFIGVSLPDRDLTAIEQKKVDKSILSTYHDFVGKVASGRNKTTTYIDSIGQGRIYSGYDGIKTGLIDIIGGMSDAIDLAVNKAGLTGKDFEVKEYPPAGLINFGSFLPKIPFMQVEEDPMIKNLKFRLQFNGVPMPVMPIEQMEYVPVY
jgi:protease-4